jgi:TonB family protein
MKTRFLVLFIMFSLAVHALAIVLSFNVSAPWHDPDAETSMKVDLTTAGELEKKHNHARGSKTRPPVGDGGDGSYKQAREASVGLENPGGAYEAYLLGIRSKIEKFWHYPSAALGENREGSAVIRFTIAADGALANSTVISSSGSVLLDEGALACVRAASPFDPLPASYNLSLLNVTATFNYRITI